MTYTVNGVVWRNRFERLWAYLLLEYTVSLNKWADRLERK